MLPHLSGVPQWRIQGRGRGGLAAPPPPPPPPPSWIRHCAIFMSAGFALPGPSASLIQTAYAFRVTWSERVCERLGYVNERY